jgi:CheY-like chemotaxis protein
MSPLLNTRRLHPNTHLLNVDDIVLDGELLDPNVAKVVITTRGGVQLTVEPEQEVIFGRRHTVDGPQPDIDLSEDGALDNGVSRLHSKLWHRKSGWWLEDLNSLNGTWINGVRLPSYTPRILGIKNHVSFGNLPVNVILPHRVFSGVTLPVLACSIAPMTVVQIEDSRSLQDVLRTLLHEIDPQIKLRQFRSGDEGLQYASAHGASIDLYFIDMRLPGKIGGVEVAQTIRQLGYPGHIVLTSVDTTPPAPLLARLNCEFATKPLHITETIPRLLSYRLQSAATPATKPRTGELVDRRAPAVEEDDRPTVRFSAEQLEPAMATSGGGGSSSSSNSGGSGGSRRGFSLGAISRNTLQRLISRIRNL